MNYRRIYDQLIARSMRRQLDGYVEHHHIIPKCMGGSNDACNISVLTPEEHYVAHQLLCKMYPHSTSLAFAAMVMTVNNAARHQRSNKLYGWLKRRAVAATVKLHTGAKRSDEARARMSAAAQGRTFTAEHRAKISAANRGNKASLGHVHNDLTRRKMSESTKLGWLDKDRRARRVAAMKAAWTDPIRRKRHIEALRDAWVIRKAKNQKRDMT